jgi:hypothetical protein
MSSGLCPVTARSAERIAAKPRSRDVREAGRAVRDDNAQPFLADGDVVVILTQVTAGGESAPQADVATFRDGKIVKEQNLGDTAMFERVYGTK